jgi:hypothetical protein
MIVMVLDPKPDCGELDVSPVGDVDPSDQIVTSVHVRPRSFVE